MSKYDDAVWTRDVEMYLEGQGSKRQYATTSAADSPQSEAIRENQIMVASAPLVANSGVAVSNPRSTAVLNQKYMLSTQVSQPALYATKPQFTMRALPYVVIDPSPADGDPVRSGDFLLWPDLEEAVPELMRSALPVASVASRIAPSRLLIREGPPIRTTVLRRSLFALAAPQLVNLSVTVQATVQPDRSIRLTGGTAILTVSVYTQLDPVGVERHRAEWTSALSAAGKGNIVWRFLPHMLSNLQASLELPAGHALRPPQVSIQSGAGTATFVIELSETGAMVWKAALEQRNAGSIPGIVRLTTSYYTRLRSGATAKDQQLSAPLGTLLANQGPDQLHTVNPQQTVVAKLIVAGNDIVDRVAVTMVPNDGQAPEQQVFGSTGGEVDLSITTQNPDAVQLDWSAQVSFTPAGWPVVPITGRMSSSGSGWAQIVKPDSWIASYTIMALLVDSKGDPIPASAAGLNYHVNGVLTFTAPYIPVTQLLTTAFDLSNQAFIKVLMPRFPNQPVGDLVLNMFATRDGLAGTKTRKLLPSELGVVVLIRPNAQIEIKTSSDTLPESSGASDFMGILAQLQ